MPEELQHLLERIQREAVGESERQAEEILGNARRKAAALVGEAEEQAKARLADAEREAQRFTERSQRALEQAGRDLLILVGNGVQRQMRELLKSEADQTLDADFVQSLLDKVVTGYVDGTAGGSLEILLGSQHRDELLSLVKERWKDRLAAGVHVSIDDTVDRGFRVSLKESNLYHDFSADAIADALARMLQPSLAEIVQRAARESLSSTPSSGEPSSEDQRAR